MCVELDIVKILLLTCYLVKQGCVQGYGNYEELTSSGVDPTKLYFDDVEDKRKSADLVLPDIVVEECDDVTEETDEEPERKSNHAQLLPVEKTRRCVRSKYLQYDHQFNPVIDVVSLCSIPSIFSLMSIPDDVSTKHSKVVHIYMIAKHCTVSSYAVEQT